MQDLNLEEKKVKVRTLDIAPLRSEKQEMVLDTTEYHLLSGSRAARLLLN